MLSHRLPSGGLLPLPILAALLVWSCTGDYVTGPAAKGTIIVTVSTSGSDLDPDGFTVSLDHRGARPVAANGALTFEDVPAGDHEVELGGSAANCGPEGGSLQNVLLTDGDAMNVTFQVRCYAPRAGTLLFTSNRSGTSHVYRVAADGSGLADLTPGMGAGNADWSPDRARIVLEMSQDGVAAIYVMEADGENPRRLVGGLDPSWSPDGREIVFVTSDGISVMSADGSNVRTLAQSGSAPSWSPDGSRIAFHRVDRSRCQWACPIEIYVMATDGSEFRKVVASTDASDQATAPAWSPDGGSIAYARHCCFLRGNLNGIEVVRSDGGPAVQIYSGVASSPVWSPDGSSIAFAAPGGTSGLPELTVIPATGGPPVVLASSPEAEYPTSWK